MTLTGYIPQESVLRKGNDEKGWDRKWTEGKELPPASRSVENDARCQPACCRTLTFSETKQACEVHLKNEVQLKTSMPVVAVVCPAFAMRAKLLHSFF